MGIKIWPSTKDVPSGMGIKIISDLVLKEICGICETKNAIKEQLKEYIMAECRIFEKFGNLSKDELNAKSNKNIYMRNNVMTTIIKCYSDEKKRGIRAIDGFRKKLMIPDSKFEVCRIWSQIKNKEVIYVWKNSWRIFC